MKTVVMRRSDREKKDASERYTPAEWRGAMGGDYPPGMCLVLDDESLKKLGIDGTPKPGEKYRIEGEMHVTGSEQRDTDKRSDRRVEVVMHELGAEKKENPAERQKSVREDIEDARHRAHGTLSPSIGPGRSSGPSQADIAHRGAPPSRRIGGGP